MKPSVYIETSVISYLTAKPSRDLIVAAHQQITVKVAFEEGPAKDYVCPPTKNRQNPGTPGTTSE